MTYVLSYWERWESDINPSIISLTQILGLHLGAISENSQSTCIIETLWTSRSWCVQERPAFRWWFYVVGPYKGLTTALFLRPSPCKEVGRTPDYWWQGQMKIFENPCFMYGQDFKNFPKNVCIAHLAPQNAKFVWIGPKITIFSRLSVSTQTNYVIIHSLSIPRIFFANTDPFSLIPFLVERIIRSVNDDGILRSHWFAQVSSVQLQDNKQMKNSENSSGHGVAPQS